MPGFPAGTELSAAKGLKGTMAVTRGGRGHPTSASLWASRPSTTLGCRRGGPFQLQLLASSTELGAQRQPGTLTLASRGFL